MTAEQLKTSKRIIKKHYELNRPVTDIEAIKEIKNLIRKYEDAPFMVPKLLISLELGLKVNHINQIEI